MSVLLIACMCTTICAQSGLLAELRDGAAKAGKAKQSNPNALLGGNHYRRSTAWSGWLRETEMDGKPDWFNNSSSRSSRRHQDGWLVALHLEAVADRGKLLCPYKGNSSSIFSRVRASSPAALVVSDFELLDLLSVLLFSLLLFSILFSISRCWPYN